MNLLNKQAILAAQDLHFEDVEVPEWGGSVRVRVMSGAARDALTASMRDASGNLDPSKYQARLLLHCLVTEEGSPMFSESELDTLNGKSAAVLSRLYTVADRLNGMGAKAVDAAEKN